MNRPHLPSSIETAVLTKSRRRCCICFGLDADFSEKTGQIAHLDQSSANSGADNLAFLCLEHHNEYDSHTRQSKGLQQAEVKQYREELYRAVEHFMSLKVAASYYVSIDRNQISENFLLAAGEMSFYLARFVEYRDQGIQALVEIGRSLERHAEVSTRTTRMAQIAMSGSSNARRRSIDRIQILRTQGLVQFSKEHVAASDRLGATTTTMLDALSRACATFTDFEGATPAMLSPKIDELRSLRQTCLATIARVNDYKAAILEWPRASSAFNKGRRLAVGAIERFASEILRVVQELEGYEQRVTRLLELL